MSTRLKFDRLPAHRPKLRTVCEDLAALTARLEPGAKLPTVSQLCRELDASITTMNAAVRELEQQGLVRCVHGVGIYAPAAEPQRALRNIAFLTRYNLVAQQHTPYWFHLVDGMRQELERHSMQLSLLPGDADDRLLPFSHWENIDGVICCVMQEIDYELPQHLPRHLQIPCVTTFLPIPGYSCVRADDGQGTREATEYLIGLGHQRIAYLGTLGHVLLQTRLQGYRQALEACGLGVDESLIRPLLLGQPRTSDWSWRGAYDSMRTWLREGWAESGCTAILTQNDEAALAIVAAVLDHGLRVPDDVSVIGCDGLEKPNPFSPRLTTLAEPLREMGSAAVNLLVEKMEDEQTDSLTVLLPQTLVIGETTGPPQRQRKWQDRRYTRQ